MNIDKCYVRVYRKLYTNVNRIILGIKFSHDLCVPRARDLSLSVCFCQCNVAAKIVIKWLNISKVVGWNTKRTNDFTDPFIAKIISTYVTVSCHEWSSRSSFNKASDSRLTRTKKNNKKLTRTQSDGWDVDEVRRIICVVAYRITH